MSSPAPPHRNVVPSEVGWQFVPQYYTFVNKSPDRLHCFYTKKSTFIHGTEGDDDNKPCHGQQEIHAKITSLGFEDCKVYIHSVDAQSSADGGIIIQVIGEMSNKGESWRKFVQTFFLAEQPNGYFVLNDIFRFLREETPEDEAPTDDQVIPEPEPQPVPSQPEPEPVLEPVAPEPEPAREPTPEPTPPSPAPVVEPTPSAPEPVDELTPVSAPEPAPVAAAAPVAPVTNGVNGHASSASSTEPKSAPAPAQQPQAAPSGPPAKPTPKTWASLAASNTRSWGSAVAKEVRATTEAPPPPPAAKPAAAQTPPPAAAAPGIASPAPVPAQSNVHPLLAAAQAVNTSHCFVKGVIDPISNAALMQQLTARFGPVKEVDVVRSKACAFIEFVSVESAKKAIIASLPTPTGGEGGVWVDGDNTKMRLTVETRKERGERPVSRPRGGGPPGRGTPPMGGSMRGRGGAGRGGAKP